MFFEHNSIYLTRNISKQRANICVLKYFSATLLMNLTLLELCSVACAPLYSLNGEQIRRCMEQTSTNIYTFYEKEQTLCFFAGSRYAGHFACHGRRCGKTYYQQDSRRDCFTADKQCRWCDSRLGYRYTRCC